MKRAVMVAWIVGAMVCCAQAQFGGLSPVSRQGADAGLEITAEKFEVDQKSGWTTATGNR